MRYMKNLSVAFVVLGLSAPALASNSVYVPSQHGGFKIAIDPLYVRKSDVSNLSNASYEWGTYAQIGYLFPYTGNDLTADYTYLRTGTQETMDVDAANLELGQRLTTGAFDFRLFSGMRYANLNYTLNTGTPENTQSLSNLFRGFGPRMGVDARYQIGSCFGLDTRLNTSLLVGTINAKSQNGESLISSSVNRLVPELDARVGIDYTHLIKGESKSAATFEIGYQTTNYFNSFNTDLVNGSGDAHFDGAYLEVKYYS